MRFFTAGLAVAFALFAQVAQAQDDQEALKKRIMEAIEKKLKAEQDQLLSDIEKLVYEELKARGIKVAKPEAKPTDKPFRRGYLGIRHAALKPEELEILGVKNGLRVTEVMNGSAAERAGLKEGDVIVSIDGKDATTEALPEIIKAKGAGATILLKVIRDGKEEMIRAKLDRHPEDPADPKEYDLRDRIKKFLHREGAKEPKAEPGQEEGPLALDDMLVERMRDLLDQFGVDIDRFLEKGDDGKWRLRKDYAEAFKGLKPGELLKRLLPDEPKKDEPKPAPEPAPAPAVRGPWLGIMPNDLSPEQRAALDIEEGTGVEVAETRPGSPAESALQKGDIILKIDDKPIAGAEGLKKFMADAKVGQECELTIVRDGKQQKVKVTLTERKD